MNAPGGSDLFNDYEHDFSTLTTSLSTKLKDLNANLANQNDQWKTLLRAADRDLEEADEILSQMDNELYGLPPATRTQIQPKYRNAKSTLEQLRRDFKKLTSTPNAREALLGPARTQAGNYEQNPDDPRAQLIQGTERLQQASEKLANTHRMALETEQSGIETLQILKRQREQLERTRNTLRNVDGNIDRAQRTLRSMARRIAANKWITAGIIFMLILLILMALYFKLR